MTPDTAVSARPLHERTRLDHHTDARKLVELAFLAEQVEGTQPFARRFCIPRPLAPMTLRPAQARLERAVTTDLAVTVLFRLPSASVLVDCRMRATDVAISAASDEVAVELEKQIRACAPADEDPGTVRLRTWHQTASAHVMANERRIDAPAWQEIAGNFPSKVRTALQELMGLARPTDTGRLLLWHGDPGTGKTTALRALLRAWEPWCTGQYIADPERFFSDPGYITQVLARAPAPPCGPTLTRAGDPDMLWRLVVAEDTDEYIRATARKDAGAGLGRLLNLADGVLGQGLNTLLLLTTNEPLNTIHPAVTRPGRCLARVEFARFSPGQAREWLGTPGHRLDDPLTLAELFELRGHLARIGLPSDDTAAPTGQYL